jgi:hypothetical protein
MVRSLGKRLAEDILARLGPLSGCRPERAQCPGQQHLQRTAIRWRLGTDDRTPTLLEHEYSSSTPRQLLKWVSK